jgi:hypothetical protein
MVQLRRAERSCVTFLSVPWDAADAHSVQADREACRIGYVIETLDGRLGVARWDEVVRSGAQGSLPFALPAA